MPDTSTAAQRLASELVGEIIDCLQIGAGDAAQRAIERCLERRVFGQLADVRQGVRRSLDTADEESRRFNCDPYAFKTGYFGQRLVIVAEALERLEGADA